MKRRSEFTICYEQGRRCFSRSFIVFILTGSSPLWRFGLSVSKKVGPAHVRNRVKRVLREFFRLNQDVLPPGWDIVVNPRRSLDPDRLTLGQATTELRPLLEHARTDRASGQ